MKNLYRFLVADKRLYKRLCPSVCRSVGWLVGPSVRGHESKSEETRISAPAHPSTTGGRVSGLVLPLLHFSPSLFVFLLLRLLSILFYGYFPRGSGPFSANFSFGSNESLSGKWPKINEIRPFLNRTIYPG